MQITFRGHSFFDITCANGTRILIDPYVENGMTRATVASLDADLVLVTHAHRDHVGQTVALGKPVVANFEIATFLEREGLETTGMNTGGFYRDLRGIKVWMAPAAHSSGFHTDDGHLGYGGAANGFIVDDGDTRFYHTGDTGLFGDMKHVIRDVMKPDIAAVPIGDLFTMGPEHAAIAVDWLGVKAAIPMHYDTFEPIRQDPADFVSRVGAGAHAFVPAVDEAFRVAGGKVPVGHGPA